MTDLTIQQQAQRLIIYIGESDQWRGQPLYAAILQTLKSHGLAGATVVRGVAGFGAHSRIHTASIVRLSADLPLEIQVVDSADKIAEALEFIAPMVREGLITLDDVRVVKYTHRYLNPLPADRPVSEVMTRAVVTLTPEMTVSEAWKRLLKDLIKAAPVVDAGQVVGILTDEDLLNRAGLRQRLSVAEQLDKPIVQEELRRLESSTLTVGQVMSKPVVTAKAKEPLGLAAARMAGSGMKRLPVVDADGKLVGVLSRVDILRQVVDAKVGSQRVPEGALQTVAQVMSPDVPLVPEQAGLTSIVRRFVETGTHRLIVTDVSGRPTGMISDADVVTRIQPPHRRGVLDALRGGAVPPSDVTARDLMSPEVLTVAPDLPVVEAVDRMLSSGRKWMIAVDDQGRPLGLVDRQALLRAITDTVS
ncbi:MAG: DUF190 domain-containing protein [Chloroflexi bacterium]|nr:DUF190 domain-containing protein [Chloroflexota bacterium]